MSDEQLYINFDEYLKAREPKWNTRTSTRTSTGQVPEQAQDKHRTSTGQVQDKFHSGNPNTLKLVQVVGEQELYNELKKHGRD